MDLRCPAERTSFLLSFLFLVALTGCSQAVMLSQETDRGGVMTYSYKEDRGGAMGSEYRKEALEAIQAKCPKGARVLREGEVRGFSSAGSGIIEGTEDESRGRRWGIQFECKTPGNDVKREHEPDGKGISKR